MSHSDAPDSPSFKIRDGLGVLGCLVIGAVIIGLGSRAGSFSLTPASSLLLGAAGQLVSIFAIVWLARRRGVRIHKLIIGKNAWWREAVLGVLGAIVLWAIAIGLWLAGLIPISDRLSVLILETSLPVRLAFFAMAVVLAPIAEELLYRGALQGSIRARFNIWRRSRVEQMTTVFGLGSKIEE